MPRVKNTRPTTIYWLFDMRPETIAAGWTDGLPFYCGKTVGDVKRRLSKHHSLVRDWPKRKLSIALNAIGSFVDVRTMEIVPSDADWSERERFWIKTLRNINANCANTADGGQGATGYVPTAEHREKLRVASTGRKKSDETLAKMRQPRAPKDWVFTTEHRAKLSAANKSSPKAIMAREKLQASLKGRKFSDEHRANLSAARKNSPKAMASALANLKNISERRQMERGRAAIIEAHGPDVFERCDWRKVAAA